MPTSEEQRVLLLLAKEWVHSGPPGIMDISDIVAALDQAPSATLQALKTLYQCGLVAFRDIHGTGCASCGQHDHE